MKSFKKALTSLVIISTLGAQASALAQSMPNVPECQFTGMPTPEQIAACQTAAAAAAGSQAVSDGPAMTPPPLPMQSPMPRIDNLLPMPEGLDMSKFPKPPVVPEGGPVPEFMGRPLAGEGVTSMTGQIGAGLEQVQAGLLRAEDGIREIKGGQIRMDGATETAVKEARNYYDQAKAAFEAGDFQKAGLLMQKIRGLGLEAKFANFEKNAISADLILDVRNQMAGAIKSMDKMQDDPEFAETKAQLLTALDQVDQAQAAFKKGDKQGAAKIMKALRDSSPDAGASEVTGRFKGLTPKKMAKILDSIAAGLARAERGFSKSKEMGTEVTVADEALLAKAKGLYDEAQQAFDKGDYAGTADKLMLMQKMDLEEQFAAFKIKAMPMSRQEMVLGQINQGIKALELTIEHSKEYGIDTSELEVLLAKVTAFYEDARQAKEQKNLEAFLTVADQIQTLDINAKVNDIIRRLANEKTKDLVKEGLEKMAGAINDIKSGLDLMAQKKVDIAYAASLLGRMEESLAKANRFYEAGDNMAAGKKLDEVVSDLIPLGNILKDHGVKLADQQFADLNAALNFTKSSDGLVVSAVDNAKTQAMLNAIRPEDIPAMKDSMMEFNPQLMDKVVTAREKDKKFIDSIMRDVMPLIPEKDRQATMEGKLGLLAEADATQKTINQLKVLKGLPANVVSSMNQVRDNVRKYNFPAGIAAKIDEQLATFNDKIQTGEIKAVGEIKNYVFVIKGQVEKYMAQATAEEYKKNLIPAKNIDETDPLFDEVMYLKKDGAVRPDKDGKIDLKKKIDQAGLAVLINNAIDKKEVAPAARKQTVLDVIKTTFGAYDVKPVNMANPSEVVSFMKGIGVDLKAADLGKQATMGQAIDIVAEADQRWGVAPK